MLKAVNLKEIEKKAYMSYHKDGLLDLFLSFMMFVSILSSTLSAYGVSDTVRITIYLPLMVILGPVLYILGKKYVTVPRLGYVKFGPKRRSKRKKIFFVVITIVLISMIIWTATANEKLGQLSATIGVFGMTAIIFLIIMAFFAMAAYITDYNRMYVLGLIIAVTQPIYTFLDYYTEIKYIGLIAYGIAGIILLIMGTVVFKNFLQKFPLPTKDEVTIDL